MNECISPNIMPIGKNGLKRRMEHTVLIGCELGILILAGFIAIALDLPVRTVHPIMMLVMMGMITADHVMMVMQHENIHEILRKNASC